MKKSIIALLLVLVAVFAVYSPSLLNKFTNWDDGYYVENNSRIHFASLSNLKSVFSSFYMSSYQPATLLFYMLEYRIFKTNPAGYHLGSLALHIANCILVLWLFILLGISIFGALVAALIFGVHPIQVESVAWVSETKGLLCAFFFFGSLVSYLYYARKARLRNYCLSLVLFILSLLSKGAGVVLPLILLMVDFLLHRKFDRKLFLEKAPFFALAFILGSVTVIANALGERSIGWVHLNFLHKAVFPFISVIFYLGKIVIPYNISCLYPYPAAGDFYFGAAGLASLAVIIYLARRQRQAVFGLLFFIICLLPAMQFVPVGKAAYADRYAYLASAGIFYLVAVLFSAGSKIRSLKVFLSVLVVSAIVLLSLLSYNRISVWRNSFTLWNDALGRWPAAVAYNNRGIAYDDMGMPQKALADYESAARINPRFFEVYVNRGNIYYRKGDYERAAAEYGKAIELDPKVAVSYIYLGSTYLKLLRPADALLAFDTVIRMHPAFSEGYYQRGMARAAAGDYEGAVKDFTRTVELSPEYRDAYVERANAYYSLKRYDLADKDIRFLEKGMLKVDPQVFRALNKPKGGR